jgi:hypothetical protein
MSNEDCTACEDGTVSLGMLPCTLCSENGKAANVDHSNCDSCGAGKKPRADRSTCDDCEGNTFSTFVSCIPGTTNLYFCECSSL